MPGAGVGLVVRRRPQQGMKKDPSERRASCRLFELVIDLVERCRGERAERAEQCYAFTTGNELVLRLGGM